MFIFLTVASTVLASFSANMLTEIGKKHLTDFLSADSHLTELEKSLQTQLLELKKSLRGIDAGVSHSEMPSDWLDDLEECRYQMEDIEESMDEKSKKLIVSRFLNTNIKYVTMMQSQVEKRKHDIEAAGLSRSTQLTNSNDECQPDELLVRGEDKLKIMDKLITPGSRGVSIIGIGGAGKTTLARAIASEASIKSYFTCILFPALSPIFNSKSVLDCIKDAGLPSTGQRVLIILEGVHSVTAEKWRPISYNWKKDFNPESKILITTQNPKVADVTGTSKYCLHSLQREECFLLIQNLANANGDLDGEDDQAIIHNEKELVNTCKGLPLLARQIGLLLSAAEPGSQLGKIKEITTMSSWKVPELARVLVNLKPVSLLVEQLNLRRCLTYCSLFPQDYLFKVDNLVQLWMAEGFTQPSKDLTWMQRAARGYFADLLACSLFQISPPLLPDEKPRYKLHELFYEMAINVASKTFCQMDIENLISTPEIPRNTRHFSLRCEKSREFDMEKLLKSLQKVCSGLRTFILFRDSGKRIEKNPTFFQSLTRLRVLDLSHTNLTKLESKSISKLKYLHYLDLSHTPLENLPNLSHSPELQVLKLKHCNNLRELPDELRKLTSLISLRLNLRGLVSMPSEIGKLTNLQRLDVFIAEHMEGLKITELRELNDLRKSLRITKLENVENKQEAQEAMLSKKVNLERLELEWSTPNDDAKHILQGLEPPKNLKELIIKNYSAEFPEWLNRAEVCGLLESIHLIHCKTVPLIDQLRKLKTLRAEAMHDIAHDLSARNGTSRNFPYIETLVLCDMPELNQWIQLAANFMPQLHNLHVENCQKLPQLDCLDSLEKLEINWCTKLEELPTLPHSLKNLSINGSDILKQRCQVGGADRHKIRGIRVVIDSEPVDTSEPDHATTGHQSSSTQGPPRGDQQTSTVNQQSNKHDKKKGTGSWISRSFKGLFSGS